MRVVVILVAQAALCSADETGIVARYTFDEGAGMELKDHSGNGHHGTIHHAKWVTSVRGHGLAFERTGGYVDCGVELGRRLTADMTILAWVKLSADFYPDGNTNWTIVDCWDYPRSGFIVRVDGATKKLYYGACPFAAESGRFSRVNIQNRAFHHVAVVRQGKQMQYFIDGALQATFDAEPPALPTASFKISSSSQSFQGIIDDLSVYGRALTRAEILEQYGGSTAAYGKDTSWLGTFQLEPFLYVDRHELIAAVNFLGLLPMASGAEAVVELGRPSGATVKSTPARSIPESGRQEFRFDLAGLTAGEYEIRAVLRDVGGKTVVRKAVRFPYPPPAVAVPTPAQKTLPPLPEPPKPLPFDVQVGEDGQLAVRVKGQTFPVLSEFSYPGGGFNTLGGASARDNQTEAIWKPRIERPAPATYRITAAGRHYGLSRWIEAQPTRVVIKDTIINTTGEPLGVLVRNRVAPPGRGSLLLCIGGWPCAGDVSARTIKANPTIFLSRGNLGLGLVALDDVFIVQSMATVQGAAATLHTDTFALDKNASYTLEWAVYPTASSDYYDFVNQVRRDERRNGTVDGAPGFITKSLGDRRSIPTQESVKLRNIKYGIIHGLAYLADDPGLTVDGIDFIDFPKERKLLTEQIAATRKAHPGMKILFHIAHSLYTTNKPDRIFPDSRVIDASGKQTVYAPNPFPWISKERFAQGWDEYIYYPTLDNSFGRTMLKTVDVIMDEIGADGPYMDGFLWAYGGEYTYDRWDGHTAEIDPKTKTIRRKMGSVLLLSQDALIAFCRKIHDKGGVVIANNSVITRTIAREKYLLFERECYSEPDLHLTPTPMTLSLPSVIVDEPDIYRDILNKLAWGSLYIYYEEVPVTHPSVPAQMYPITFEEIRSGYVKGRERLITMHSGLYGWHGNKDLHFVYLYDTRGACIPHSFLTTVDAAAVRTQVDLAKDQCAVVKRIPLGIQSTTSVNLRVTKYDAGVIELAASGSGSAVLTVQSGEFSVKPTAEYVCKVGVNEQRVAADAAGTLAIRLELNGQMNVGIMPSGAAAASPTTPAVKQAFDQGLSHGIR
jgi:hypothetical protein